MAYDYVLVALADPTRRELYTSLRRGDRTVSELAALTRISQPAASQHLRVLRAADLVTERREGTRRYYRASTAGLEELRDFVESLWDDVLAAFAADDPAPPRRATRSARRKRTRKPS
jgi:DNA-binding transcriptional ArsR family regulator